MCDIVERRLSKDILQKAVLPGNVSVRNLGGGAFKGGRRLHVVAEQGNTPGVRDTDQVEVYGCAFDERVPCRGSNSERYQTGAERDRRTRSEKKYASFLVIRVGIPARLEQSQFVLRGVSDDLTDGDSRTEVPQYFTIA